MKFKSIVIVSLFVCQLAMVQDTFRSSDKVGLGSLYFVANIGIFNTKNTTAVPLIPISSNFPVIEIMA